MLKTSPGSLANSALARAQRKDIGETATWVLDGNGPRILFVHGFRGDHHGLMAIAGAMPEAQIVVPDLPGYGKTEAFSQEHNLDSYGRWLKEFVEKAGPFDLVLGHSFGTLVVAAALSQGLRVKTVLLNPITSRASEIGGLGQQLAERYYRLGHKYPSLLASPVVVRGMSVLLTKTMHLPTRSFIHAQHASFFSNYREPRVAIEGFRAASNGSVFDYLSGLDGELLLIAGERDIVAPVSKTVELRNHLPNSQLEVIPKVGHLTHYETPMQVAKLVEGFVKR